MLARVDLGGLSAVGVRAVLESVLLPPRIEEVLAPLGALPEAVRVELLAQMLGVAEADAPIVPAEEEALGRATSSLGLDDRGRARAEKSAALARWEREKGLERAERLDNVRNLLVLGAGLGAPLGLIFTLGTARTDDLGLALIVGVYELGFGLGTLASVVAAMVVSVVAAALVSFLTLRGRTVERLVRERVAHAERVRTNLALLVEHLTERVRRMQSGDAQQRAGLVAMENRLQQYVRALTRLKSVQGADEG